MTCHLSNKAVIKQNCIEAYKAVYNLSQHHQRRSALHAETRISYGSPLFVMSLLAPTRQDIKPVMPQLTSHFDQLHFAWLISTKPEVHNVSQRRRERTELYGHG